MTSSLSKDLLSSGHMGLFITHGSMRMDLPPGVSIWNVAWPSQVILMPLSFRFMSGLQRFQVSGVRYPDQDAKHKLPYDDKPQRLKPKSARYVSTARRKVVVLAHGGAVVAMH